MFAYNGNKWLGNDKKCMNIYTYTPKLKFMEINDVVGSLYLNLGNTQVNEFLSKLRIRENIV